MAGRARAALAAKNNPQLDDVSWKVYKTCGYCSRDIMVNNYPDRKTRTPMFLGLVICPWCDPRHPEDRWLWRTKPKGEKPRITNRALYKTLMGRWLALQLTKATSDNLQRIVILAERLFADEVQVQN